MRISKTQFITCAVFTVLLIIWFLQRPNNALQLAIGPHLSEQSNSIKSIFEKSKSTYDDFVRIVPSIPWQPSVVLNKFGSNSIDPMKKPNSALYTAEVNFKLDEGPVTVGIEFNGNNILDALYSWVGYGDYHLIFTSFEKCNANTSNSTNSDVQCYDVIVRLHPINSSIRIQGSAEYVANRIGVYIFLSFASVYTSSNEEKEQSVRNLVRTVPTNYVGLKLTMDAFQNLRGRCVNPSQCLLEASKKFRKAIRLDSELSLSELDRTNYVARVGLGLTELAEAVVAARNRKSTKIIREKLIASANNLSSGCGKIQTSGFVFANSIWLHEYKLFEQLFTDLPRLSDMIKSALNYRCAFDYFVRGQYEDAEILFQTITPISPSFDFYVNVYINSSRLAAAKTRETAEDRLNDFWKWLNTLDDRNERINYRTLAEEQFLISACHWGIQEERVDNLLLRLQKSPPIPLDWLHTQLTSAMCELAFGNVNKPVLRARSIGSKLNELPTKKHKDYASAYLEYGLLLFQIGDYEGGIDNMVRAALAQPKFYDIIHTDVRFASFRDAKDRAYLENFVSRVSDLGLENFPPICDGGKHHECY